MGRRNKVKPLSQIPVPDFIPSKVRPPLLVVLGSPTEVIHLLSAMPEVEATCWQMDLFQADRLRMELSQYGLKAKVETSGDVWDLPELFGTVIYLPPRRGERELKIDMVDQSQHVLRERGTFMVWSPYDNDPFFGSLLKKIYGRIHIPQMLNEERSTLIWTTRETERPRRRHEVTIQCRIHEGESKRFVSRPGTFSYGKFDNGARALCEVMEIEPGDRILDLGCGIGTNGIFAAQAGGESCHVAFVDSNMRATALTELNAKANGVGNFEIFATSTVEGPQEDSFDVCLANPPYFANSTIAQLFIQRGKQLLTPQGKFYIVTKQTEVLAKAVVEVFEEAEAIEHRGYTILVA
jgi:16S rRNA (guanine1207-N2)-methyltransferase